jgi:hypothetical protein
MLFIENLSSPSLMMTPWGWGGEVCRNLVFRGKRPEIRRRTSRGRVGGLKCVVRPQSTRRVPLVDQAHLQRELVTQWDLMCTGSGYLRLERLPAHVDRPGA